MAKRDGQIDVAGRGLVASHEAKCSRGCSGDPTNGAGAEQAVPSQAADAQPGIGPRKFFPALPPCFAAVAPSALDRRIDVREERPDPGMVYGAAAVGAEEPAVVQDAVAAKRACLDLASYRAHGVPICCFNLDAFAR